MAISISIKKFKGREYVYIVDNYRDPITKRPTSRTLVSFGSKEKLLAADLDAMTKVEQKLKELQNDSLAYSNTVEQRLSSGTAVSPEQFERPSCLTCTPAVFHPLWEQLGLTAYFRNCRNNYKLDYDLDKTVFFSCISRLVKPSSKLSSWRQRAVSSRILMILNCRECTTVLMYLLTIRTASSSGLISQLPICISVI